MRWLKNVLLVLFTLLLVAGGALMPGVTCYIQDSYGANRQETRSFDSFRLTLRQDSETARLLRRVAGGNYWMEEAVDWAEQPAQPVHTSQQAGDAAMEVMEWMVKCGVLESRVLEELEAPKTTSSLLKTDASLFPQDEEFSENQASLGIDPETEIELIAITWDCWWPDVDGGYYGPMVRIDDAMEKVLMATVPTPRDGKSIDLDKQVRGWQLFLEDHYGFKVISVEEELYADGGGQFIYDLDPEDGDGVLRMVLNISEFDGGSLSQLWPAAPYVF